ncbi:hypothetical protein LINGRAHAP2_LOCUS27819 [Linum grandiflorum]
MAQFTTQGRLKFLFNSGGAHYKHLGSDSLDGSKSFQLHKARLRFFCSSTRLHAKPGKFYAQARRGDGRNRDRLNHDEDEEDYQVEFQTDELACFRGLVLDIAYRYCYSSENLTIDHVFPASRGGEWKWENLVAACSKCNSKKGQKTLEEVNMKLIKMPKAPKEYEILAIPLTSAALMMLTSKKGTPQEWRQYLPPQP